MGFAFHKYFVEDMMNGSLDKQPDTLLRVIMDFKALDEEMEQAE